MNPFKTLTGPALATWRAIIGLVAKKQAEHGFLCKLAAVGAGLKADADRQSSI
jgi:hypothetical protein